MIREIATAHKRLAMTGCGLCKGLYVTKPFHLEDIRIKVERLIDAKKAKKALKKMTGIFWALIISIPIWLILGIILGLIWK